MAETWTTAEDVRQSWLGNPKQLPDDEMITRWINAAEMLIFAEVPDLRDRLTEDTDGEWRGRLVYVTIQLVFQVFRNPEKLRQISQTSGPFSKQATYAAGSLREEMALTAAHRTLLGGEKKRCGGFDMTVQKAPSPLAGALINGPLGTAPGDA